MSISTKTRVILPTGLALFAMFFGAGNMIFPLELGSTSGQFTWIGLLGFLISGVGVPFIGLFAGALYQGNYWEFFERIGRVPAFIVITFLILFIGPLFAAPRTETIAFETLSTMLPRPLDNVYVFDFIYFSLVYLVISKKSRVIDIIGLVLSPVKIATFTTLIILGLALANPITPVASSASEIFNHAIIKGYSTMDLLASLFFCTVAYKNIQHKCAEVGMVSHREIMRMTLWACCIGAVLISLVYMGFIFVAATHAQALQGVETAALLGKVSYLVLGQYGSLFVGICITFACLTTASALAEVTTEFFHEIVFKEKISRNICVYSVLITMYIVAIFGFDKIMAAAVPVLSIIYPALILLCLVNIVIKLKELKGQKI